MTPEQRKHFEFVRDEMHGEPKQEQSESLYQPAAIEAVDLIKFLGYVYQQTPKGLAWVKQQEQGEPQQRKPLTGDATTFVQRFTDAVGILCGSEPPSDFVTEWLANVDVNGVHRLQEWVLNQDATPAWAQGIGVLDAAHLLASTPVEGEQHEDEAAHGIKE